MVSSILHAFNSATWFYVKYADQWIASNSGHSVMRHNASAQKSGIQDCYFSTLSRNVPRRRVRRWKQADHTRQEVKVDLKSNLFIGDRLCLVLG